MLNNLEKKVEANNLEKKTENKAYEFFDLSFLSPSTLYKSPNLK